MLRWPDGAIQLVAANDCLLMIEPTLWRRGPELVSTLLTRVPDCRPLQMDARPEVPQPESLREVIVDRLRQRSVKLSS